MVGNKHVRICVHLPKPLFGKLFFNGRDYPAIHKWVFGRCPLGPPIGPVFRKVCCLIVIDVDFWHAARQRQHEKNADGTPESYYHRLHARPPSQVEQDMDNPQADTVCTVIMSGAFLLTALDKLRRMLPHMRLWVQARHCFIMVVSSYELPPNFPVGTFPCRGLWP
jgi:hypothetical protein